ncbi:hypothetical protein [Stomatohabitans albus]|uniref:hypothetical protein n=1 Tax=Stomatohabitans albus TaxID=3110766 RepID=UPI00300C69CD
MTEAKGWQWLRYGYVFLITAAFCYALVTQADDLITGLHLLGPIPIANSIAFATGGVGCSGLVWYGIIRSLGGNISLADGARMFFITQLGKYVPGSVWPVLMQADVARRIKMPIRVAMMAQVLFMWVLVVTGTTISIPLGIVTLADALDLPSFNPWLLLFSLLFLVVLHPKITSWVTARLLALFKRPPLPGRLSWFATIHAIIWAMVMWGCFGGHLYVLTSTLNPDRFLLELDIFPLTMGFAGAWVIGFIIIIAPAGAGPREAALYWLLAAMNLSHAVVVIAISRLALTVADGIWAGLAALTPRPASASPSDNEPVMGD